MAFISIPHNLNTHFCRYRWMPIFLLFLIGGIAWTGFFLRGINYGIDFKGGLILEIQLPKKQNLDELRATLKNKFSQDVSIQELGGEGANSILIRTEKTDDIPKAQQKIQEILGKGIVFRRMDSVGPKMGAELIRKGIEAIAWALLAIMVYIWLRFEWQFGVCAVLALIHDCIGVFAFFALSQKEFNEGAIVAFLITASYSINDTVVIFDRVRENRIYKKGSTFLAILDSSINETLPRTLLTSITTLLALLMLYIFGGSIISDFSFPILVGLIIGTYSSIFIAVPLLVLFPEPGIKKIKKNTVSEKN